MTMSLHCYICCESFDSISDTFKHLKTVHKLKNKFDGLQCIVKGCHRSYVSFDSLRAHARECSLSPPQTKVRSILGNN